MSLHAGATRTRRWHPAWARVSPASAPGRDPPSDEAIVERVGYDPQHLAVFRAACALVTSNCSSASGRDGHFAWCVAVLDRPEVRAALAG